MNMQWNILIEKILFDSLLQIIPINAAFTSKRAKRAKNEAELS